jgi:hypothetical protein
MAEAAKKQQAGGRVVEFLSGLTAADLAEIDQQIQDLRRQLASLEAARRLIDLQVNGPPERKKGGPRKSPAPQTPAGNGPAANGAAGAPGVPAEPGGLRHERRLKIARLLGKEGPMAGAAIFNRLDIPLGSLTSVMSCDWFTPTNGGYRLTEVGRREAGL